ncbi:PREDICTED: serine/threonine-protein kinase RIO1 [Vollenhovia emeryi]|uniref:serine/threonine-protein kinase RIO1 n=1 Tax=Vollenhovia emeryi TaxID=411798 RepID=UPI0005F499E1|nr:PREDICTED: serine/threonine-protein kinase RIO1 [Vollenhovia emeryi]
MSAGFVEGQFSDAEEGEQPPEQNTFKGTPLFDANMKKPPEKEMARLNITGNEDNDEDSDGDDVTVNRYCCNYDLDERKNAVVKTNLQRPNTQNVSTKLTNYQPKCKLLSRYANKINLEKHAGPSLPDNVANVLIESDKKMDKNRARTKDKSDHATIENVLDSRIRYNLYDMFAQGVLKELQGCISTGKEANVYYGRSPEGDEVAIKIYRTSVLAFKNRDKYIKGDYRFKHVHSLHNPRKMVKLWAKKEFDNLNRLMEGDVRAPRPIKSNDHIVVMEFQGLDGWAAPKLKDVVLTDAKSRTLYRECIEIMWKMYNRCKLVHADLSEYNILYHNGSIVVIDVSQAVDRDHDGAMEFLRKDCDNITVFFRKHNVNVMPLQSLFDFITDPTVNEDNMDEYLDMRMRETEQEKDSQQQQVDEAVFKQAYIPQRLTQVVDVERDINLAKSGKDLIYKTLLGLKADLSKPAEIPEILANKDKDSKGVKEKCDARTSSEASDDSDSGSETDSEDNNKTKFVNSARPRNESPESRKARKKAVKEQQAEKRKSKIKKHVKKRKIKVSRGGK